MRKTVLVEGMLLLLVGLASMAEGLRVAAIWKVQEKPEIVGPGYYLFFISVLLVVVGVVHIIVNYRKTPTVEEMRVEGGMRIKMISMVAILGVYILTIDTVGYSLASFLFFLLEFRVVGIKSWRSNIILSLASSVIYYFVFVGFCDMIFPPGKLFR
jgi:putative tricarboxylic transport membrane protein